MTSKKDTQTMPLAPKPKSVDATAAIRQQRRRERLKKLEARMVRVVLTKTQGARLDTLLALGYAGDQSTVLAKALDAAFGHTFGADRGQRD